MGLRASATPSDLHVAPLRPLHIGQWIRIAAEADNTSHLIELHNKYAEPLH
jgi:hypothetical protein